MQSSTQPHQVPTRNVNPQQLLYSLMIPAIIMPLSGWMFSVSLPIIRDELAIAADVAAWIATTFSLPFMILMPVIGRLSDSLGKRRLLLLGISIFAMGTILASQSTNLPTLLLSRAVQGMGAAGLVPLALALITETFPPSQRGQAMGMWSSVGPATGVIGPILAGLIVANWGWRIAFLPAAFVAFVALLVVFVMIPATNRKIDWGFLRLFDWVGVALLSATLASLLFYLSSRPITGVPPLQDWRLFLLTCFFLVSFIWRETRRANPFIHLHILKNRTLVFGSIGACLRMMALSGALGFVMPLYLADVVNLDPKLSGWFLMVNPLAMVLFVRFAGKIADRWGSRQLVMVGFSMISAFMFIFSWLPSSVPPIVLLGLLFFFGVGAGLMLASLHRAALNDVPDRDLGTSSGIYSMVRFLGSALGGAIGGILLQYYLERNGGALLLAYQSVFVWFGGFGLLGLIFATQLPRVGKMGGGLASNT